MSVHARRGKARRHLLAGLTGISRPPDPGGAYPQTGRTHQLRVHLASEGHPVLGDATYGGGVSRLAGHPKAY